jgi:hypothetical protein
LDFARAAQRQCALAGYILELDCDVQADIDRNISPLFSPIGRRLRMAWDAERKHLYAGQKHPPHDALLLYVLPEEFQKPN